MTEWPIRVILAQPRGFCAGVERAIDIVERALALYGPPVYVRHEIVHNKHVVESLRARGARFVDEVDEIPSGALTIFSAHGVSMAVEGMARERDLHVIDATCPLVTKVHREGRHYAANGFDVVLIGHKGHAEVDGTIGQIGGTVHLVSSIADVMELRPRDPDRIAYVTQTTLSVDDTREIIKALVARFPRIVGPQVNDICYATQNRQVAVRELAQRVDVVLVVGAANSSNSNRLREIGAEMGKPCYLIADAGAIDTAWFEGASSIGITAGASAPEVLVSGVVDYLASLRPIRLETMSGVVENVRFRLPSELDPDRVA
ncbi:MAG: 4-hydroxy-3-methylbut-2-enyl diphosphate reductase [Alphaproteobacteria bacterium]